MPWAQMSRLSGLPRSFSPTRCVCFIIRIISAGLTRCHEEFVRFIENWEIESYRSKVSTGV